LKVDYQISDILDSWDLKGMPFYLKSEFLDCFFKHHNNFQHLFFHTKKSRIYAQVFNLRIDKTANYTSNRIFLYLLSLIRTDVLYLSNSFFTNRSSFFSLQQKMNLQDVISDYKCQSFMIVIPDVLMSNLSNKYRKYFQKIEVEEDMILNINSKWCTIDDYKNALKTKYRSKLNLILKKSENIVVKNLTLEEVKSNSLNIQDLFNQVVEDSRFRGPFFNTETLLALFKLDLIKIYGYYINDVFVAFSTEIHDESCMYSYYVGFNKKINKEYSLYGRILFETIRHSIECRSSQIVFGRTTNEYKSNFGAEPLKSYFYVRIRNNFLNYLLSPFLKRMHIRKWIQRKPFKKNS
jgi:hypothetical protein